MKNRVLICGAVRNCSRHLEQHVENLSKIFSSVCDFSWYVVESDSSDLTVNILQRIANKKPEFLFTSLGHLREKIISRTERIAYCRNIYLEHFRATPGKYSHLIVVDLDDINKRLNVDKISRALNLAQDAPILACQKGPYYDVWALRHAVIAREDCYVQFNGLMKFGFSAASAHYIAILSKMRRFDKRNDLLEVESAFGGFGMYPAKCISESSQYFGRTDDGIDVCEHVSFSKSIRDKGHKIFIDPQLINSGFTAHYLKNILILLLYLLFGFKLTNKFKSFLKKS